MNKITDFDKKCLQKAISIAKETFKMGNYPVGAVLAVGDKIIGYAGNEINKQKSFVDHAENLLIIKYGKKLAEVRDSRTEVSLYTTLEPCIQCLGAAVTNHVDRIIFIEKDPNGGACNLKHDNIGLWYKEFWPLILQHKETDDVRNVMVAFFKDIVANNSGNIKWAKRMLSMFK
jgi:tRNA(adenine34) deaminase